MNNVKFSKEIIDFSSKAENDKLRAKKIGIIYQDNNLLSDFTAIENVMLPMTFQNKTENEKLNKAKALLESVGLGHRMEHKPGEMSGGERQRVAIARALANDPEVILADEPTGNLDSKTGKQIMEILCKLNKDEKRTIVLVTHDVNIAKCAERTIRLKDGRVIN